jgi:TonB family protein
MKRRQRLSKRAPLIAGVACGVALMVGLAWVIHGFMASKNEKPARMVQNITVIRPPPPPPDEPPPPPPDKVDEPIPQNEPEPTPDNAPTPSEQLGLDAEGAAGDDGFGLAARKGGSDLVGTGGAAFAWYTGRLKDEVTERLSADAGVRAKKFTVVVRVWIESDGRIRNMQLVGGSGSRDLDTAISAALATIQRLNQAPPLEMPQPISLRIVSRTS